MHFLVLPSDGIGRESVDAAVLRSRTARTADPGGDIGTHVLTRGVASAMSESAGATSR